MLNSNEITLTLLQRSLWKKELSIDNDCNWNEIERIVKNHCIGSFFSCFSHDMNIPSKTRESWLAIAAYQISYNRRLLADQDYMLNLLKEAAIPVAILKGAAASQYYRMPILRPMGDIDFIVPRNEYEHAYNVLSSNGFILKNSRTNTERNIKLIHSGFSYELHQYFATSNIPQYAQCLDDLIMCNIFETKIIMIEGYQIPVLPDLINGLVLLQHINQHLESGIGLRQIIDWMMFYSSTIVTVEIWREFHEYAIQVGLDKLEKYVTDMCIYYIGMKSLMGLGGAEKEICYNLLQYILSSGNFGQAQKYENNQVKSVLHNNRSLLQWIQMLHQYGNEHWKAAKKYPVLRPFASFYQIVYYFRRMIKNRISVKQIGSLILQNNKQKEMLEIIGAKIKSKGSIVYENGKYEIR